MSGSALQQKVQQRLGVKYVAAKQLTDQALDALGMTNQEYDEDIVVDTTERIFSNLSAEQQNEMRLKANSDGDNNDENNKAEPEWKRKARLAAEKREYEWKLAQQQGQQADDEQGNAPRAATSLHQSGEDEPLQPGQTRVTSSTTTSSTTTTTVSKEGQPIKKEGKWRSVKKEDMPENFEKENPEKVKHVKVVCSIM